MPTPLPTWDEFMIPALRVMADGGTRALREIRDRTVAHAHLSAQQLDEQSDSGYSKATNRIGWAVSYLKRVGALDRPSRGQYVITPLGRDLLKRHPDGITERMLRTYAQPGDEWWQKAATPTSTLKTVGGELPALELDPIEMIDNGTSRIHAAVAADLLSRLHANEPAFFEQAVLDLLIAMGYGGAEGRATRTRFSGDGGIDGVIDQDALGLSRVYVQAKRYALDASIGRPEIQAFVGALQGNRANQGVFITTARYSTGAREYAKNLATRVVLIDGERLASLMIRYGVGVQVRRTVNIVEVDEDFFE